MATFNNIDDFFTNAAISGTHTVSAGNYSLADKSGGADNLVVTGDWVLITDGGEVTVTGSDANYIEFRDCDSTVNGIVFTNLSTAFALESTSSDITFSAINCQFNNNIAQGFLIKNDPAGEVNATLTNCTISSNSTDGVSILTSTVLNLTTLTIDSCIISNNGTIQSDQGATAHSSLQRLNLLNSTITGNSGPGVSVIGYASLHISNCNIHDNASHVSAITEVLIADDVSAYIEDTNIYNAGGTYLLRSGTSSGDNPYTIIDNCNFYGPNGAIYAINCEFGQLYIRNSVIRNFNTATKYAFYTSSAGDIKGVIIDNCIIYDCYRGFRTYKPYWTFRNTIFHTIGSYVGMTMNDGDSSAQKAYLLNSQNGNNYFYNIAGTAWFNQTSPSAASQYKSTDTIEIDPLFIDVSENGFQLSPNSPCLNTGKSTIGGGCTSIGVWQRISKIKQNSKGVY